MPAPNDLETIPLEAVAPAKQAPGKPDKKAKEEEQKLKREKQKAEIKGLEQDIQARKVFAWAIFGLTSLWLATVATIVVCAGLGWLNLNEKVLITLITSGMVNVVGLFHHVAKYLYRHTH